MDEIYQNNLNTDIRNLTEAINKLIKRQSPWVSFTSGIMHSLGYFVGFAIIAAILIYILQNVPLIPMIGDWLGEVMNQAVKNVKTPSVFPLLK